MNRARTFNLRAIRFDQHDGPLIETGNLHLASECFDIGASVWNRSHLILQRLVRGLKRLENTAYNRLEPNGPCHAKVLAVLVR